MATIQKAIRVGSSIAAVLPKALLRETGIMAGSSIALESVDGGVLVRLVQKMSRVRRARTEDERVAQTALDLINRYRKALEQLAEADKEQWETVADFTDVGGISADRVLIALKKLDGSNRKVSRRA